jgi:hypothetical protein
VLFRKIVIRSFALEVELERDFGSVKLSCSFNSFRKNRVALYLGAIKDLISPV